MPKIVKEYMFNERTADQDILLKFADQEKAWPMDKVSNAGFTEVIDSFAHQSCDLTFLL